jgi:hypothetical protein
MISSSVRPAYLGSRYSLRLTNNSIHSLSKNLPTLSSRKTSLLTSQRESTRSAIYFNIPAKLSRDRDLTKTAASTSGGHSEDSEDESLNTSLFKSTNKEVFNFKDFFFGLLRRALAAAAVLSSLALALLALSPTLLSHPSGLSTALHVVNATVPAVTLEIHSVKVGWKQPLEIKGVKILEKIKSTENTREDQRRTLVEIEKVKSTATLLDFAVLGRGSDILVVAPQVDVTVNESGNLRVLQALQDAGLAPKPRDNISQNKGTNNDISIEENVQEKKLELGSSSFSSIEVARTATVTSSLQEVSTSIPFTGEIRAGNVHVALTKGRFLAPTEFQELFSSDSVQNNNSSSGGGAASNSGNKKKATDVPPQIHFEVLMGGDTIEEEAQLEEQSAGFVDNSQETQEESKNSTSSLAEWARQKPSDAQLPSDVGYLTSPIAVRVDSAAFKCTLAGWRTSAGYTYLASPVEAEMKLTPTLARVLMNRLNPLLGDAVELRGSSKIAAWIMPSDHVWPSTKLDLQLSPLRLNIKQGAVIARGLDVLSLADRKIGAAAKAATLQVDVSPLKAEIAADGKIVTKRVDLAVGKNLKLIKTFSQIPSPSH